MIDVAETLDPLRLPLQVERLIEASDAKPFAMPGERDDPVGIGSLGEGGQLCAEIIGERQTMPVLE